MFSMGYEIGQELGKEWQGSKYFINIEKRLKILGLIAEVGWS